MNTIASPVTRLLLVDDDQNMVRLLATIIRRSFRDKIDITSITQPYQARTILERDVFDIVITDLEMPGINGLELLRCAKRRNPFSQVLLITGHSSITALTDALELGATDYLTKPIDQQGLLELIRHAQERQCRWQKTLQGAVSAEQQALVYA